MIAANWICPSVCRTPALELGKMTRNGFSKPSLSRIAGNPKSMKGPVWGLAITKRLVELMGGSIRLESKVNEGTTFAIRLKEVAAPSIDSFVESESADRPPVIFETASVLVVEDNATNRVLIRELLEEVGLRVLEAENGKIGLELAIENEPELILMDISMPVMNGVEATRQIWSVSQLAKTPIVVLTASMRKEDRDTEDDPEWDGYLTKPIQRNVLFDELKRFLPHRIDSSQGTTITAVPDAKAMSKDQEAFIGDASRLSELVRRLETDMRTEFENCSKRLRMTRVQQFAEALRTMGQEYQSGMVVRFARNLEQSVNNLDIAEIKENLKGFPPIVETLKQQIAI